jgi:hypothetical protein
MWILAIATAALVALVFHRRRSGRHQPLRLRTARERPLEIDLLIEELASALPQAPQAPVVQAETLSRPRMAKGSTPPYGLAASIDPFADTAEIKRIEHVTDPVTEEITVFVDPSLTE